MAKRGFIGRVGSAFRARISRPGFDVDVAGINDMLLHEDLLFSQPFFFRYVANPFGGYTGNDFRDESVTVNFTNPGGRIGMVVFPVSNTNVTNYPMFYSQGSGNDQLGYNVERVTIRHSLATNSFTLRFIKAQNSRLSAAGANVMLTRAANA